MSELIWSILAIAFALSLHEAAHAWMANRLGDPTGKIYGRISLNPLRHYDLIGTIILPFILIVTNAGFILGWAKPVPFNPDNLRSPKRDAALIALAGPISNLLTALVCAIPLNYLSHTFVFRLPIEALFNASVLFFSLNILPFPPLDGSKIIGLIVPRRWEHAYANYLTNGVAYVVLFVLFDAMVVGKILPFSIFQYIIDRIFMLVSAAISLYT